MSFDSNILDLCLSPIDFFLDLTVTNLGGFTDAFFLVILLSTVYRFLIAPITGGGSGSSDTVKKEKKKN